MLTALFAKLMTFAQSVVAAIEMLVFTIQMIIMLKNARNGGYNAT